MRLAPAIFWFALALAGAGLASIYMVRCAREGFPGCALLCLAALIVSAAAAFVRWLLLASALENRRRARRARR